MTLFGGPIVPTVALLSMNLFAIAMLLTLLRLFMGPSLADRVVALDLIAALAVGFISVYSVFTNQPMLLRVAILIALVVFVGTVAFAFLLEKRGRQ